MVRGPKKAQLTDEHVALVLAAAKGATEILQSHGIPSAIFGSLASKLYGASRPPKVRNMVVIQAPVSPSGDRSRFPDHSIDYYIIVKRPSVPSGRVRNGF